MHKISTMFLIGKENANPSVHTHEYLKSIATIESIFISHKGLAETGNGHKRALKNDLSFYRFIWGFIRFQTRSRTADPML